MDSYRLYDGYPLNKNHFFAPSVARSTRTSSFTFRQKRILLPKEFVHRIVTPVPGARRNDVCTPDSQGDIRPETLSYHIYRNSLNPTSVPLQSRTYKYRFNAKTTLNTLAKYKLQAKSRDVAIQNMSTESLLFPGLPSFNKSLL